jgi:NTE family protein
VFSPYELNPLGLNPLRDLLERAGGFRQRQHLPAVDVHVTATNVRTGRRASSARAR